VLPSPPSPGFEQPQEQDDYNPEEPKEDDSETRSAFVSQLAARLTARDLGYFFEDKLGEGTVLDSRIVTDRISRRSKGYDLILPKLGIPLMTGYSIGYVEFRTVDLVEKALNLNGTIVMGLPISVQYTEAERNRTHAGDGCVTDLTDLVLPCYWLINKSQEFESSTWRVPPWRNAV
jgi:RNA-binding protein 39